MEKCSWIWSAHAWARTACSGGLRCLVAVFGVCCVLYFMAAEGGYGTPGGADRLKSHHSKSKRLTVRCRVTWAWSVNSTDNDNYRERIKKKCDVVRSRAPVICTGFPPPLVGIYLSRYVLHHYSTSVMPRPTQNVMNGNVLFIRNGRNIAVSTVTSLQARRSAVRILKVARLPFWVWGPIQPAI